MSTKVTLRQKTLADGKRKSLYLDFYPPVPHPTTGKPTRREFLGLYIIAKPKNPLDKDHNKEVLRVGETIRQKRANELGKPEIYNEFERERLRLKEAGEKDFTEYFRKLAKKRKTSNYDNWTSTLKHFENYTKGKPVTFADLTERFCNDFREYLLSAKSHRSGNRTISQNSALSYFNKFKATLKQAYKDGLLSIDLNPKIGRVKEAETRREYLTLPELQRLVETPCSNPTLKQAALFSALTGLRFSDILKLVWSELEYIPGQGHYINFQQKKTKGIEVLPISEQAYNLLGEVGKPTEKVFAGLKYSAYQNKKLAEWIREAGISKPITFHSFRHSFATLQLANGTDIYTVSKLLGHRDLKTTQIYAKVVDEAKREAADKIKLNF